MLHARCKEAKLAAAEGLCGKRWSHWCVLKWLDAQWCSICTE